MKIPTCSYVSRGEAYKIVKQFILEKKIPDFINWVELYDIEFDYDF